MTRALCNPALVNKYLGKYGEFQYDDDNPVSRLKLLVQVEYWMVNTF